jgi:hypothetical protein
MVLCRTDRIYPHTMFPLACRPPECSSPSLLRPPFFVVPFRSPEPSMSRSPLPPSSQANLYHLPGVPVRFLLYNRSHHCLALRRAASATMPPRAQCCDTLSRAVTAVPCKRERSQLAPLGCLSRGPLKPGAVGRTILFRRAARHCAARPHAEFGPLALFCFSNF